MASAGSIFVDLLLNDGSYREGLRRTGRNTQNSTRQWNRHFSDVTTSINTVTRAVTRLAAIVGASLGVGSIVRYSDAWKSLEGRLNVVSETSAELSFNQERLFDISQRTRSSLDSTVTLYQRLTKSVEGLGISQEKVFKFTEQFNKALITSGLSAQELRSVTFQLTQAFNKGKLDGDEFRSVLENAPPVLEALVASLRKTNEGLAEARARIIESARTGALTPQILTEALAKFDKINERFEKFPLTVGQAFVQLDNAFLKYIGQSELIEEGTSSVAKSIQLLAENLNQLAAAVGTAAAVYGGVLLTKLVPAISAVIIANAKLLVGLEGTSTFMLGNAVIGTNVLAASYVGLANSLRLVGAAFKAFIPVAVVGAIFEILDGNESLIESEKRLGNEITEIGKLLDLSLEKQGRLTEGVISHVRRRIQAYAIEREELQKILDDRTGEGGKFRSALMAIKDAIGETVEGLGGLVNADFKYTSATEAAQRIGSLNKALTKLDVLLETRKSGTAINVGLDEQTRKFLERQREVNESLRLEADLIGKTSVEIDKLKAVRKLEADARVRSLEMGDAEREVFLARIEDIKAEREAIIQSNSDIARSFETGVTDFFTSYVEDATNAAENIKNVLTNAFKSAEDALVEFTKTGKISFRDLASSIIEDLLRIQLRQLTSSLVSSALSFGLGGLGGLFGGATAPTPVLRPLPAFADGGFLAPGQFGIAGEEGAELLYGGNTGVSVFNQDQLGGGGNVYNIDARGADQGAVVRLESALLTLAGPGVIENRVISAQQRGSL